ncbi:RNA polymerase II degradation factor 1-like isoform X2 [Belonocnema kinseyi]|nr:RNA polymerase II degradation factor 1-like isoform X2 [Belonocnema kinseyi]
MYGTRSCGSVTGDSGVTSQHEERLFRKDLMPHNRRHSIQSVSIPLCSPTTNFSRVVTPSISKYSELRFVDPPRSRQSELSYSHQQSIYSTPKTSYNSKPHFSSVTQQIPEICVSPTFTPNLVSRDVQTDKPINSMFNQSFGSVNPCKISGISRFSQTSTQALPQYSSPFPNEFSNKFSNQVTPSPQIDVSQYLYTPSLPKTSDLGSRNEFRGLSGLDNTSRVFRNSSPTPNYPDYSWRYPRSTNFEEKSPRFEKNSIFERSSIFNKSPTYERNSRFEDKSPTRFFRRLDFNTSFRRNDRPLPSSRDILSSTREKPSLKPFRLSTSLKSDYDAYERSKRLDNELDRYIGKIRNLHKDVDLQSLEDLDHEQNTSGDLLNVTLSDDDIDLPVEEKSRGKRLPKKADMPEVFGKELESEELTSKVPNTDLVMQIDAPVFETRHKVSSDKSDETSAVIAVDGINSEIAKGGTEIAANAIINDGLAIVEERENRVVSDESKTSIFGELVSENDHPEVEFNVLKENGAKGSEAAHAEVGQTIEVTQKTGEEKKIVVDEIPAAEDRKEDIADKESKEEKVLAETQEESNTEEGEKRQKTEEHKENQDPNQEYQYDSNQGYNYDPNDGYQQYPGYSNETFDQYNEQYDPNQQYPPDPSQYPESPENYNADLNQQYNPNQQYGPSEYVQDPNQQYEQDPSQAYDPNQQYEQDPSQQYAPVPSQEYAQVPSQQYVPDPSQEYVQDPNQQYPQDPNQEYAQDPNQEYVQDPNQQYAQDPIQEHVQDPNQQYTQEPSQYDPNQQYQDPNVQYDPNQAYDYSQSQEYSEQDQTQSSDPNYIPEAVIEGDKVEREKAEVKVQEKEGDLVDATSDKKKELTIESDTDSTIERNASNTESDFDFN